MITTITTTIKIAKSNKTTHSISNKKLSQYNKWIIIMN